MMQHFNSPLELKKEFPLSVDQEQFIKNARQTIKNILNGDDPRLLLIVGPCSIHDIHAATEYAHLLSKLSKEVSSTFYIVMRSYFEKPRTKSGWKGFLYDPDLNETYDMEKGLKETRKFLLHLSHLNLPAATEFLNPNIALYIKDLISWGCIGARTTESQVHRELASSLDMPVSFKNNTSGNIKSAINGIASAMQSHTFMGMDENGVLSFIKTEGNSNCHLSLRGSETKPNYDPESIQFSLELLKKLNLTESLLIDCSHGNSGKDFLKQAQVFQSVIHQIIEGNQSIKGLILESHLFSSNQTIPKNTSKLQYGVSITDPCLDFATSANLISWAFEKLNNQTLNTCKNI